MSNNHKQASSSSIIKALRKLLGDISQADLGYRIGVSVTTVSRWETGAAEPTFNLEQIQKLEVILKGLGLEFSDLPQIAQKLEGK